MTPTPRQPVLEGPFDLAIIGGGINGVAVAREAVLQGLTVCLFEKGDFASGTSGRSSKMLHGGIRYLEQLQLGLVFESLRERSLQLQLAPHLAAPQTFVIPVYKGSGRGPRMIRLGIMLYDLLALGRRIGKGRWLSPTEVASRMPGLNEEGLLGGGLYFDGVMDDARLCLANILDANQAARPGQLQFRNYARVRSIVESSPLEVEVEDQVLDTTYRVLANRIVRVVGPWTDVDANAKPLLVPSKGVHLVLPELSASALGPHGLLLTHSSDGRVFFVIPWRGKTLVGTTETPFEGRPDNLKVEPDEVEYLLAELQRLLPGQQLTASDILGTFAGVRPLARTSIDWGGLGKISRRHRMVESGKGVLTVVGGKYTNYRAVAEEILHRVAPGKQRGQSRSRPLHGGEHGGWKAYQAARGNSLAEEFDDALIEHLFGRYGARLEEVLDLVRTNAELGERLSPEQPEIRAEVVHGVLAEEVHYPSDFICRRTDLRYARDSGRDVYDDIERLIEEHGAPLNAVPPDLAAARDAFMNELDWEEQLRGGKTSGAIVEQP